MTPNKPGMKYIYTKSVNTFNSMKLYFLLSRPYTLVEIALLGLLANIIATQKLVFGIDLTIDVAIFLCFWLSLIYSTEVAHKDVDKRNNVSIYIPVVLFLAGISIVIIKNVWGLIFIAIAIMALPLYILKIKNWYLSGASFLARGIFPVMGILTVLSLHHTPIGIMLEQYWQIMMAIFLLASSRNLIGDIRDYNVDKYTLPRKYGVRNSFLVSEIFILMSCVMIGDLLVIFPLILVFFLILIHRDYKDAYHLHRVYILASLFFLMNYNMLLLQMPIIFNDILFLGVILNFTYDYTPRSINRG